MHIYNVSTMIGDDIHQSIMSSWFGCNQNVHDKPEDQRRLLEHRYGDPDREYEAPTSHPEEQGTYEDFQHAIGSFYAVVAPVTLTMILARYERTRLHPVPIKS